MDHVHIRSQEVNEMAGQLQVYNGQLRTCLNEVTAKMRQLHLSWDSPAGFALQERFLQLLPVFERYEQVVEQYATYLRQTAQSYQDADSMLKQQAQSIAS